jgi:hypothetical protein
MEIVINKEPVAETGQTGRIPLEGLTFLYFYRDQ